jgi:pre-mRNA-splicing factor ISY1
VCLCPYVDVDFSVASLSDYQIRDLNDDINRMMKEKYAWEVQLRNLGGPNYGIGTGKVVDDDGKEVPGQRGYRYYGRARELPGAFTLSI